MAKREALRELQSRLASRLQTARTEGVGQSWLAVQTQGANYLLPLHQSGEIFPWESAHTVPYTQPWFVGVANLRGGLYGVADMAGYVAQSLGQPWQRVAARNDSYVIALNTALEVNCALLVDRLVGLRNVEYFIDSSVAAPEAPPFFGHVYRDAAGAAWQEIDLQVLSRQSPFLSIGA